MVDPNDVLHSPSASRTKLTRKKTVRNHHPKQRKSNERSRLVSIRSPERGKSRRRTRSGSQHKDTMMNNDEKQNESVNQGFTQFIQTKMMERKKRQGKRLNQPVKRGRKPALSPSIKRKREQSVHDEPLPSIPKPLQNDLPSINNNEQHGPKNTTSIDSKLVCPSRCESKENHPLPNNKRRRPCLCSKKHLDELEFAYDTLPSQVPIQHEQQCEFEEPYLAPNEITSINHSPVPHLRPSSQSAITSIDRCSDRSSHSFNDREEADEPEHYKEKENELRASSILAMPLSPTMPPNVTYMTRKSLVPIPITPLPTTLLALSSMMAPPRTTAIPRREGISVLTSCLNQTSNLSPNIVNQSSLIEPIQTTLQEIPLKCSVSTQTEDLDHLIHHPCHDVSECPCVRIYTRSEQLFMTNMSVFFRNSMHLATGTIEQVLPTTKKTDRKRIKKSKAQVIDQSDMVSSITPIVNEILPSMPTNPFSQTKPEKVIDKTYVVQKNENIPPLFDFNLNRSLPSPIPVDTSTVINETRHERSKKSDGSSIQIHLQTREEQNDLSISTSNPTLDFDDRHKFKSIVLTMTALKEKQKAEFHRFVEFFSIQHSSVIDDTTTHLITDEDADLSLICPLTGKVLQAVARHLIIVSYRWLTACLSAKRYINEIPNFEIIGDNIYEKHHGMSRSRLHSSTSERLLANYAFHFKCNGCQPFTDNRPLIELINLSGGLVLNTLNQHIHNIGRQIIILCSKTYLQNKPALQQACQKFNILCLEPEWLIATIVQFQVQPFQPWQCTLYR